ncbi:MAG: phosphotransferase family protein [Deltaproteobacteria bacterium]|nr:phosphotransferase family protein [Deltaproteobacteria bacterium]
MSAPIEEPVIAEALRAAFGDARIEGCDRLAGGLSGATVLKIAVGGRNHVLRRIQGPLPMNDPRRQVACMTLAAERGIAPRLRYANADTGVTISEFIAGVMLGEWIGSGGQAAEHVARLLRSLHEGPLFPDFMTIPGAVAAMAPALSRVVVPEYANALVARVAELGEVLRQRQSRAACHNDLNPNNFLFDGKRLWLVDWELACAGDPFFDLAELGVYAFPTPERRAELHQHYFGHAPDGVEAARLQVCRVVVLTFYALAFINLAHARGVTEPVAEPLPALVEVPARTSIHRPAWFGRVLLQQAWREASDAGLEAALDRLG